MTNLRDFINQKKSQNETSNKSEKDSNNYEKILKDNFVIVKNDDSPFFTSKIHYFMMKMHIIFDAKTGYIKR